MNNLFINVPLSKKTIDLHIIRSAIFRSINNNLKLFKGDLLDIGCGKMPYKKHILENSEVKKYVGLDIEEALIYDRILKPDVIWDGQSMPFDENVFDCAFGTEVLEHCPNPEIILNEVYRVLKRDGVLFFTVPFLWPLHEVPNDEYRYTPFSLKRHLEKANFKDIKIRATGGWHASMAQMLGLWVKRSGLSKRKMNFLSILILPIIKILLKYDNAPKNFQEGQMITGLYGFAFKK